MIIMKFFILPFAFLTMISPSLAVVTFEELDGVYDVHSTEIPIRSVVTITKTDDPYKGEIFFKTLRSPFGKLNCNGTSEIDSEENQIETTSRCKSGLEFYHVLDLEGIDNFDKFSTQVRNTLYGDESIKMYFNKKKKKEKKEKR